MNLKQVIMAAAAVAAISAEAAVAVSNVVCTQRYPWNGKVDIDYEVFENYNIHIHVPEGAVPKDGPSAGITMVTSLASALTRRKVKANLAMTGEISLRGKVLPVGGIKEKILAAKRAGIKEIILCEENRRNISEIPEMYLTGLTFHYVTDIKEVWKIALLNEKVE